MKLVEVNIANVKGVSEIQFHPGTFTLITGYNSSGKTSILDAIRTIWEGGHSPSLIREGAKRGVVTLIFDNGVSVSKVITPKTSTLTITDADGREVKSPKAYVEQLSGALAVDPLRLLTLKPKELAQELLDTLGIEFPAEEVAAIAKPLNLVHHGIAGKGNWDSGLPWPLTNVESLISSIREDRKLINRSARDAEGTITDLTKSLKDVEKVDLRPELAERQNKKREVEDSVLEALGLVDEESAATENKARDDFDAQIDALKQKKQATLAAIERERGERRQAIQNAAQPERQRLTAEIATLQERISQSDRDQGVRDVIESHRDRLSVAVRRSDVLTLALERLEAMKQARLKKLPIVNLTFENGEFFLDGLPFFENNQARQTAAALEIALLKSGELRVLIVDNAEHMDSQTVQDVMDWARENKAQIIAAAVTDEKLLVESKA